MQPASKSFSANRTRRRHAGRRCRLTLLRLGCTRLLQHPALSLEERNTTPRPNGAVPRPMLPHSRPVVDAMVRGGDPRKLCPRAGCRAHDARAHGNRVRWCRATERDGACNSRCPRHNFFHGVDNLWTNVFDLCGFSHVFWSPPPPPPPPPYVVFDVF
jgi:hypothetical protein